MYLNLILAFSFFGLFIVLAILCGWFRTRNEKLWRFFLGLCCAQLTLVTIFSLMSGIWSGEIRLPMRHSSSSTSISYAVRPVLFIIAVSIHAVIAVLLSYTSITCFRGRSPWRPN